MKFLARAERDILKCPSAPLPCSPNGWADFANFWAGRILDIHRIKLDSCDFVKRSDWKLKYRDLIVIVVVIG